MIASKKPLKLVKYEGPQDEPTPEERFGKKIQNATALSIAK
jgi:hypothetical protein